MKRQITDNEAIDLLKKYSSSEKDFNQILKHVNKVKEIVLRITSEMKDIDKNLLSTGALLHDIGRFRCPPGSRLSIQHGIIGAKILRDEGLEDLAKIAERHIGIGLSAKDIENLNLPLPNKDFLPISPEEMLITYADNLDHKNQERDEQYVIDRFSKEIGPEYANKVILFHKKIHELLKYDRC